MSKYRWAVKNQFALSLQLARKSEGLNLFNYNIPIKNLLSNFFTSDKFRNGVETHSDILSVYVLIGRRIFKVKLLFLYRNEATYGSQ